MRQLLVPLVLAFAVVGCQNPNAGDIAGRVIKGAVTAAPAFFITDKQEVELGRQTMAKVLVEMPEFPNPELRDYVNEVGQKVAAASVGDREGILYEFRVLHSAEINAFAAPGGFLFVTTGALRVMKNEAQLAGVLGHEVAHVAKKHSINGIQQAMVAQGLITGALDGNDSKLIETGATIGASLILKGFGRGQEEESDRLGARYAYASGYNPLALGGFLDTLRQTAGEVPNWLVYFSDHPRTDDRLVKIEEYVAAENMSVADKQLGEAIFKMKVLDKLAGVADPAPRPAPEASEAP
ncbi:MAG: M48 family metallopeptidase [Candidatus Sericytochromatia bacterium]